jgi:hypothetical protein
VKASEVETLPVGCLSRFQNSLQLSWMDISRGKKVGRQVLTWFRPYHYRLATSAKDTSRRLLSQVQGVLRVHCASYGVTRIQWSFKS